MNPKIVDWIINNGHTIVDICLPLLKNRDESLLLFDDEYHEEVKKQYVELVLSKVCDEVCRDLGCSAEEFYQTIEGTEDQWILHTSD